MAAVGIDLGTINSCVAVCRDGRVEVIANDLGIRITPSFVTFDDRNCLIGNAAKTQLTRKPEQTVFDVKLLIGMRLSDSLVVKDIEGFPFNVMDVGGLPRIRVNYKNRVTRFAPEEISAMVLGKMKETAEKYLGEEVVDAVIAVPIYFNEAQRKATVNAGKIAGLNVMRIINEPTAAALAYVQGHHALKDEMYVLIFDLGARHLNVAVVEIGNETRRVVRASAGGTHMGGADFDSLLLNHLANEFMGEYNKDIFENKKALQRLRSAAEVAKVTLTSLPMAYIDIDALVDGIDFTTTVTREFFESLCNDMFTKIMGRVEKVLDIGAFVHGDIDRVVMVGGSSRIPKIQDMLEAMFPGKINHSINLDEAVASGAALLAAKLREGSNSQITDIRDFEAYQPEDFTTQDVANMIAKAKAQRDDDMYEKEREDARHKLEKYAYNVKSNKAVVDSEIDELCDEALSWIGENETIDRKSLELRLDSLQSDVNERLREQAERDEQVRREEQARRQEQDRLEEQARLEEEHIMEEARLVEQAIREKQARLKEQLLLEEQTRLQEQAAREEQGRLKEKSRLLEISLREEQVRREAQARLIEQRVQEEQARLRREEEEARTKKVESLQEPMRDFVLPVQKSDVPQEAIALKYEEKDDQQTKLARIKLKNYVTMVLSEMKRDDSNFRVKGCLAFIEHCEDILQEIVTSTETKEEFNNKQQRLHDEYLDMKERIKAADEEKRLEMLVEEKDLESQRSAARKDLEEYIRGAKDEMFKYDYNMRNADWDEFVNYCFKTYSWVLSNDRASKEMFDAELYSMIKRHADTVDKLKEHKNNVEHKVDPQKKKKSAFSCILL